MHYKKIKLFKKNLYFICYQLGAEPAQQKTIVNATASFNNNIRELSKKFVDTYYFFLLTDDRVKYV